MDEQGSRPATAEQVRDTLAFAPRYDGRKPVHHADEVMAGIVAGRLVEHLAAAHRMDAVPCKVQSVLMEPAVILVRRQSPDWAALSNDYRNRRPIDPKRYVPDHEIFGFPLRVDLLIEQWNSRFKIDFFTFRHAVAQMSRQSVRAVCSSTMFDYSQLEAVADTAAKGDVYVYFHDDDDFFAPNLVEAIQAADRMPDAIVTPLFRIGLPTLTFIREGCRSDIVWGLPKLPSFRFQTNNYGINGRRCRTVAELLHLKDHVFGSDYADSHGFQDQVLSSPISATVKTPASASMLPGVFASEDSIEHVFKSFVSEIRHSCKPAGCEWIIKPVLKIAELTESVFNGAGYEGVRCVLD